MSHVLDIPTEEERKAVLDQFYAQQRTRAKEGKKAVEAAKPALARLCRVLCDRSGQCYKVRALLWSLYNGQDTSLSQVLCLDWEIRQDLCAVILAFGFEETVFVDGVPEPGEEFFYDAMKAAVVAVGQWDWFIEEFQDEEAA